MRVDSLCNVVMVAAQESPVPVELAMVIECLNIR